MEKTWNVMCQCHSRFASDHVLWTQVSVSNINIGLAVLKILLSTIIKVVKYRTLAFEVRWTTVKCSQQQTLEKSKSHSKFTVWNWKSFEEVIFNDRH